jgi:antitoxin (DNA-binding transcriptional repressor) of toxin-antitoxin stability system
LSLAELIGRTAQGERVLITQDGKPVAELVAAPTVAARPVFGSGRGTLTIMADDEEHL